MADFAREWLDLREPADVQARNVDLLRKVVRLLGSSDSIVVDLGCGTGATTRAFSQVFRTPIRWRLVDRDPVLLGAAAALLGKQAEPILLDLAALNDLPLTGASLVTTSALFDLCSASFVSGLANRLAQRQLSLYAALNYDGTVVWELPHPHDSMVVELFNSHQRSDKGLGTALGPEASGVLASTFTRLGYDVICTESPWHLSSSMASLQIAFINGIATAVGELGQVEPAVLQSWRLSRLAAVAAGASCRVGHLDLLASPASSGDHAVPI